MRHDSVGDTVVDNALIPNPSILNIADVHVYCVRHQVSKTLFVQGLLVCLSVRLSINGSQTLPYVRNRTDSKYIPARPQEWLHPDHRDQSESWQLTGHSTTQEEFICHFLSKPN